EQPRLPYERRALTLRQLKRLARCFVESGWLDAKCEEFNEKFKVQIAAGKKYKKEPNLYAIDEFLVKPATDPAQFGGISAEFRAAAKLPPPVRTSSFAEVLNAAQGGVPVDFFVSHFWGHLFRCTMAALTKFAASKGSPLEAHSHFSFWICLFAVNQHCAAEEVGSSPEDGPFNAALEDARGVVMVVDERVEPFTRIWCLYEVQRVHALGKTFELIDKGGSIAANLDMMRSVADSLEIVSAVTAQASVEKDKWDIWFVIADPWVLSAFGTAGRFKDYVQRRLPGQEAKLFCQFDARLSELLAEPLLRAAVEAGDQETALRCIAWGARGQEGDFLHKAMRMWWDDLSVATVKTRFSAHPQTLSHVMAFFGNCAGLQLLREAGVDLAASTKQGSTPAHLAAQNGHVEVLRLLREAGADLAASDEKGSTPAHVAAQNGHVEVLQLLREAGADLAASNKQGSTPAHVAALSGHMEVLQLLREAGADLAASTKQGSTPAHFAAQSGHVEVLRLLREAGADLAASNEDGWTPAHLAAQFGHVEVLQLLREAGADLAASTKKGSTPAQLAAQNGHVEVLQLLREAGADLAASDEKGRTPALSAALSGHVEVLQLLREAGADLAASNEDGWTPAHLAAQFGHVEVLQLLREAGADLAASTKKGSTPAQLAAQNGHVEVLQLLREAGADLAASDDS
ncbi:unnamed protein product, partial [Polarella glacialis]